MLGRFDRVDIDWLEAFANPVASKAYHALSAELTVPVPEPATAAPVVVGLIVIVAAFQWRYGD